MNECLLLFQIFLGGSIVKGGSVRVTDDKELKVIESNSCDILWYATITEEGLIFLRKLCQQPVDGDGFPPGFAHFLTTIILAGAVQVGWHQSNKYISS